MRYTLPQHVTRELHLLTLSALSDDDDDRPAPLCGCHTGCDIYSACFEA